MKKYFILAFAAILIGAGCSYTQTTPIKSMPPTQKGAPSAVQKQPTTNTSGETVAVVIKNFVFSPASISVKKGDKIVFTNNDSAQHTVTADGGGFSSDSLAKDQSFTLDTASLSAGNYGYYCSFHPSMKGTITIQ
mgnify:CR=1 FL=1